MLGVRLGDHNSTLGKKGKAARIDEGLDRDQKQLEERRPFLAVVFHKR